MMEMSIKMKWRNIVMLIVAGVVNSVGVALFLIPAGVLDGGLSGLSVLLNRLTLVHVSIFIVVLNVPFFIFGLLRQGFSFILYSLIAILCYSGATYVFQNLIHLPEMIYTLVDKDIFLCSIFGGLISGIGSGLTIRFGGAIDGIEVMAVLFAKKIGITVGTFVMIFNAVMYIAACFLFQDFSIGLYSIVTYAVGLKAVDFVVEGLDKGKACIIITKDGEALARTLSEQMGRGITLLDSKGYFSGENRTMIYCVVNRFEIGRLKKLVSDIDTSAFVTISDISEMMGSSVRYKRGKL